MGHSTFIIERLLFIISCRPRAILCRIRVRAMGGLCIIHVALVYIDAI